MKEIGKITHYYGKIGVAIVELSDALRAGDRVKIENTQGEFEETVGSMQVEHQPVNEAKAGTSIGLKVAQKVHEGAKVYKLES